MVRASQTEDAARAGRIRRALWMVAPIVLVLLSASEASAQCVMCRRALESPEGRQMIAAFQSGILILLAAPFAVFAIVARLVVRLSRLRRQSTGQEG